MIEKRISKFEKHKCEIFQTSRSIKRRPNEEEKDYGSEGNSTGTDDYRQIVLIITIKYSKCELEEHRVAQLNNQILANIFSFVTWHCKPVLRKPRKVEGY